MPGKLAEIFPLRFRLSAPLRFHRGGGAIIAEAVGTGRRYSLKPWQYEILSRFDGKRTFEEIAKEIYIVRPGAFTAVGLLNFYQWLCSEDLALCECESIFELIVGDFDSDFEIDEDETAETGTWARLSAAAAGMLDDARVRRSLGIAAGVVLCLSVVRLVQVAAPVFEPPVQRLYAEMSQLFQRSEPTVSLATSERSAEEPTVERVALAARMPAAEESAPVRGEEGISVPDLLERVERLRVQLEECRIRRDEFYLQNDEEGYRREVHRMTDLAKEIGDLEKES